MYSASSGADSSGQYRQPTSGGPSMSTASSNKSSLLLSPPNSRSFPFGDGNVYMENALLVPYDNDGREQQLQPSNNSSNAPDLYEQPQDTSNYRNNGQPSSQFAPGEPCNPMQPPTAVDMSNLGGPSFYNVSSDAVNVAHQYFNPLSPPTQSRSPLVDVQNDYNIVGNTPVDTLSSYPYSNQFPNNAPATTPTTISGANLYAKSAIVGQPVSQMTTSIQPASPQFGSPPSDATSIGEGIQEPDPIPYVPVHPHWFYCKEIEKKTVWFPFTLLDSMHLEDVHNKGEHHDGQSLIVATDGGRYDVYVHDRVRCAIYWDEEPMAVRRATWFYRSDGDRAFVPYEEHYSEKLEEEYCVAVSTNTWHRRLEFPEGETVVIHNPQVIVHYKPANISEWDVSTVNFKEGQVKPRVVRRGMDEAEIVDDGEALQIDHLVFVVHGIGAICDLKFRTLPEAVGDFRLIANGLLKSHFRNYVESGRVGRVEFLPVSWHNFLHGDATGIDEKLKPITLKSIPKLRYFANDTILDVLFYTSPVYCQAIVNQVSSEINRIHSLFLQRNPSFTGKVSLCGHSLGSVILFDLLDHQPPLITVAGKSGEGSGRSSVDLQSPVPSMSTADVFQAAFADNTQQDISEPLTKRPLSLENALQQLGLEEYVDTFQKEKIDMESLVLCGEEEMNSLDIPLGPRMKIMALVREIKEENERQTGHTSSHPLTHSGRAYNSRGRRRRQSETMIHYVVGMAGTGHPCVIYPRLDFQTTCFFAIGSPVAMFLTIRGQETVWENYKLPNCSAYYNIFHPFDPVAYRMEPLIDPNFSTRPVLIPHHKGRKRMHLEIKESLSRVGADLKQKVVESLRSTWNTIHEFAKAHRASTGQVDVDADKLMEDDLKQSRHGSRQSSIIDDDLNSNFWAHDQREEDLMIGQLNGGRRIDYVLQEKPIESFNEYLFALQSHTCYWESEDTVLLMLKEIYSAYGIHPSSQHPDASKRVKQRISQLTVGGSGYGYGGWDQERDRSSPSPSRGFISASTTESDFDLANGDVASGVNPTSPSSYENTAATSAMPPPLTGFVKQSAFRK